MPNVSLTAELERFADACVQSGRYNSVSEVTRAALRFCSRLSSSAASSWQCWMQRKPKGNERDSDAGRGHGRYRGASRPPLARRNDASCRFHPGSPARPTGGHRLDRKGQSRRCAGTVYRRGRRETHRCATEDWRRASPPDLWPTSVLLLRSFPYLLVYAADTTPPRILRIPHTSRDLPPLLGDLGL
jgi:Arc/MetJ-type ribon-helix-helix transcriptional regulator